MYQIDKTAFGAFVAALRRERGMTQRDLAAKLFISDKAVSKWETGASLPDISLLALGMVRDSAHWLVYYPAALMTALSAGFGLYFCLFAKTRLPWYHDVGNIEMYCDGPLRMNMPGVRFTNQNWPHILLWVRAWCLLTMTGSGAVCLLAKAVLGPGPAAAWLPMAFLPGLLAAIYVPGRKNS